MALHKRFRISRLQKYKSVKRQGVECVCKLSTFVNVMITLFWFLCGEFFVDAKEDSVMYVYFKIRKKISNRLQVCWHIKSQSWLISDWVYIHGVNLTFSNRQANPLGNWNAPCVGSLQRSHTPSSQDLDLCRITSSQGTDYSICKHALSFHTAKRAGDIPDLM